MLYDAYYASLRAISAIVRFQCESI